MLASSSKMGSFLSLSRGKSKSVSFTKKLKKYRRRNTCLSILLEPNVTEEVLYDTKGRDYFTMQAISEKLEQRTSRNRVWTEFERKSSPTTVIAILHFNILLEAIPITHCWTHQLHLLITYSHKSSLAIIFKIVWFKNLLSFISQNTEVASDISYIPL